MSRLTPKQHAFMMSLRPMDLLRVNGKLRVVRDLSRRQRKPGGRVFMSFTFTILHCSWTHRPYTVQSMYDLAGKRIELVSRDWKPRTKLERQLQTDCERLTCGPSTLDCCDVKGIP